MLNAWCPIAGFATTQLSRKKSEEGYQCAKTAKQEGLQHDGTASEEDDIHDTAVYKEEKKGENGPLMYLVVPRR